LRFGRFNWPESPERTEENLAGSTALPTRTTVAAGRALPGEHPNGWASKGAAVLPSSVSIVTGGEASAIAGDTSSMPAPLIEFPADDPDRARRFWHGVLGVTLAPRPAAAGSGWQSETRGLRLGVHERGPGPGDTACLPYFSVADMATALERVLELGGSVIHPGDRWAVCRDSEGSAFGLAAAPTE
jgi:predicted enzyme related to lactoylglutathione lyase